MFHVVFWFVLGLICSVCCPGSCIWFVFLFEVFLQWCIEYTAKCCSMCWLAISVGGIFAGLSVDFAV
jgi:hypothetical protein